MSRPRCQPEDGGSLKPWVMETSSQVRPAPPPALDSEVWTRDVNEIREFGSLRGAKRIPEQTEIARFWFLAGPRTYTPLVQQIAEAKKLDLVDSARLYALVSMATANSYIAVFDAKYAYNFWRPITAIRNADITSNAATPRDPAWTPLGATPMHPEYPCAHCIIASTVAEVLQRISRERRRRAHTHKRTGSRRDPQVEASGRLQQRSRRRPHLCGFPLSLLQRSGQDHGQEGGPAS